MPNDQLLPEMIEAAKVAFEQGEGLSLEYRLGNVLLAMSRTTPPSDEQEIERAMNRRPLNIIKEK